MATTDLRAVRRSSSAVSAGVRGELNSNEKNELLIAGGLPSYAEMTRKGQGWSAMAVVAVAGLVVRPTTAAAFEVWNGYSSSGPSLIIDRLFTHELVTSTTGLGGGANIWAQVTTVKAAPAAGANVIVRGNSGKAYGGSVVCGIAALTVIDSGWFPWGPPLKKESAGAVVPGGSAYVAVEGRLIVPPGCSLCLHVVSGYTGDTFCSGAGWYEETVTNEA